jgi:hypothetical protein
LADEPLLDVAEVCASDSEVAGLDESTPGGSVDVERAVLLARDNCALVDGHFFERVVRSDESHGSPFKEGSRAGQKGELPALLDPRLLPNYGEQPV